MSYKLHIVFAIALLACSLPLRSQSERNTDFGAIAEAKASTTLWDMTELEVEEELRFKSYGGVHLDRWLTSLSLESPLPIRGLAKRLHAGVQLDYIRHYDDSHYYDNRLRTGAFLSYSETVRRFKLSLRTRVLMTYRDERTGDYRVNPKWYWRNKLQATYQLPGSRFKYTLSTEAFMRLRALADDRFVDQWRTTLSVNYRLTRRQSVSAFVRMDNDLQVKEPFDTYYIGCTYNHEF